VFRALHPFVVVSTDGESLPLDTDRASELSERLWLTGSGRALAERIDHAVALRAFVTVESSERSVALETISAWIAEAGEEAVGDQVLKLRDALRARGEGDVRGRGTGAARPAP
jgi:hypothetical protein